MRLETRSHQTRRRGEQGITLIEILIILAILGVLAAILVPNILHYLK